LGVGRANPLHEHGPNTCPKIWEGQRLFPGPVFIAVLKRAVPEAGAPNQVERRCATDAICSHDLILSDLGEKFCFRETKKCDFLRNF
jgi:hypothetical protein